MQPYHHIINISKEQEPHKGNLYLGGVSAYKMVDQFNDNNIKSILSILDNWAFGHFKIQEKLDHLQIK